MIYERIWDALKFMPKNKSSDLDELLAKSQRLTSSANVGGFLSGLSVGLGDTKSFRGVAELREASQGISSISSNESGTLEAFRQLSQRNFDAKKLQEEVSSRVMKSRDESGGMRLEGVDIEGYLAHHHDMIVIKSIDDAMKVAERNILGMQRRWADNEWSAFRNQYMSSLGHRVDNWGANSKSNILYSDTAPKHYTPGKPGSSAIMNMSAASPYSFDMSTFRGTPSTTVGKTTVFETPLAAAAGIFSPTKRIMQKPVLSEILIKHADIIRSLVLSAHSGGISRSPQLQDGKAAPCAALADSFSVPLHGSTKAVVIDGMTKHDMNSYKAILTLLSAIVSEDESNSSPAGFFSPICFDSELIEKSALEKRKLLSKGAMRYLEQQMWRQWSQAVDDAVACGELKIPPSELAQSRMQRIKAFVNYQQNLGIIPNQCRRNICSAATTQSTPAAEQTSLWAFIYHAIRCGDVRMAASELQKGGNRNGEAVALLVLNCFVKANEASLNLNDRQELHYAVSACHSQYQSEMRKPDGQRDVYRAFVFGLLSVGKLERGSSVSCPIPEFTIEDFMWSELWFIQSSRSLGLAMKTPLALAHSLPQSDEEEDNDDLPRPITGEAGLYDLILEYGGADYFDSDRNTPFKYATVLFICQRYGDAVVHLWTANKVIPAVHLTVLCLHYGLILPHVPLTQNPFFLSHRTDTKTALTTVDLSPEAVIKRFVENQTFLQYPEIKLDYTLSLDTDWLKHCQSLFGGSPEAVELMEVHRLRSQAVVNNAVESLVLSLPTDQLLVLVGDLVTDTNYSTTEVGHGIKYRQGGRMDEYLPSSKVDLILRRCAFRLAGSGGEQDAERAVLLYRLAGSHAEAVDELCKQLASHLTPSASRGSAATVWAGSAVKAASSSTQRNLWRGLGEQFVDSCLQNKGPVSASIQRALSQYSLADVLKTMVELCAAVDSFVAGEYGRVLDVLDGLPVLLLPQEEDQVSAAVDLKLHDSLAAVLDDVLLMAMRAVRSLYEQTRFQQKSSSAGFGGSISSNLFTDKDQKIQKLKSRASAILMFACRVKSRLRYPDTVSVVSKIESSLLC